MDYFNISTQDLGSLRIEKADLFNCRLIDSSNNVYKGFQLSSSEKDNAITLCDVDFQRSASDSKYQPRIVFRRTDKNLQDKRLRSDAIYQRISFQTGGDGYREFWKMVAFLYKFKDLVDFGEFESLYSITSSDVVKYLDTISTEDFSAFSEKTLGTLRLNSTIETLRNNLLKLGELITSNSSETEVQNWIDEDKGKYRRERCMIFGIEYCDFKREGGVSGNRYDLLTKISDSSEKERVLIELKSPGDHVLDRDTSTTINNPKLEYSISKSLARAIPQILEYRCDLESKRPGDAELQKIGEQDQIHISKCIIVIGKSRTDDARWLKIFNEMKRSLASCVEIWTYTDLQRKLETTVNNLTHIS